MKRDAKASLFAWIQGYTSLNLSVGYFAQIINEFFMQK